MTTHHRRAHSRGTVNRAALKVLSQTQLSEPLRLQTQSPVLSFLPHGGTWESTKEELRLLTEPTGESHPMDAIVA